MTPHTAQDQPPEIPQNRYRFVALMVFTLFLAWALWYAYNQQWENAFIKNSNHQSQVVVRQLGTIQDQLQQVAKNLPDSPAFKTDLSRLAAQAADVNHAMKQAATHADVVQITLQLTNIQSEITAIQKILASNPTKHYLDAKLLPFQVISVDVIADQPFVSVSYGDLREPLGIEDSLAGWKLVSADFTRLEAEFENAKGELIKVSVPGATV